MKGQIVPQIAMASTVGKIARGKRVQRYAGAKIVETTVLDMGKIKVHWKIVLRVVLVPIAAMVPCVQMRIVRSMF